LEQAYIARVDIGNNVEYWLERSGRGNLKHAQMQSGVVGIRRLDGVGKLSRGGILGGLGVEANAVETADASHLVDTH
jgi:hypothetical protein